ncbi:MAG: S8 family serine peptidase, partial [Atopobium minutum]|nr:S8 family serine peptidase [Atopobium minutum]
MATYVVTLKDASPDIAAGQTPDQYIASLQQHAQTTQADLIAFLDSKQATQEVHSYKSFYIINSLSVVTTADVAEQLRARQDVAQVVVSGEVHTQKPVEGKTAKPSLRSDFSLFDMFSAKAYVPWNLKTIMADKAQAEGMNGAGVVVGIIDSGVDATHPAIKNAWRGNTPGMEATSWFDANNPSDRTSLPTDATGHGTHVAGTILGTDPQNKSLLGVAPKAQWIAAKVFDSEGETSLDRLIAAGEWMMAPTDEKGIAHPELRPQVINSSWGGKSENEFYRDILKKWRAVGILPVFSAGNVSSSNAGGEGSIGTPASYPEAFAVGALRKDDKIAKFSLRGPSDYEGDIKPDISAPGVNILSSVPNNLYALRSGTSMASPHVAGVAALVYQANPQLTPDQVEQIITSTATPLSDEENVSKPNHAYGYGKINAYNAVKAAQKAKESGSADVNNNGLATLSGKILAPGQDEGAATIKHSTLKTMFNSANFDVQAQVSDDNGVKSVVLYLAKDGSDNYTEHPMTLIKGSKKDGVYSATLKPSDLAATGGSVTYYIAAVDVTDKTSKTTTATCAVKDGIGIGYKNDFEEEVDGFEFGGKTPMWEWGTPHSGPNSAASGSKLVATKLDGTYKGLKDTLLITPVIDLSKESRSAVLRFKHWYELGVGDNAFNDTAEVWVGELQNEGTDSEKYSYKNVQLYKYSSHNEWKDEYIDLSAYKGKKVVVMFALRHGGGFSERTEAGWYIDDLAIEEASNEMPATPSGNVDLRVRNNYRVSYEFDPLDNPKITQYNLYRSTSPTGDFVKVSSIDKRTAGSYTARLVDEPTPQEGTYYYCATAQIGERESAKSEVKSVTFTQGTKVLSYNFEKDDDGWTSPADAKGTAWTRGTVDSPNPFPDSKVGSMPSPDQAKGKNPDSPTVWGTELNTFRKANATYTLVSPTMDLSKLTSARVYMQMWYNTTGRKGADEWSVYDDHRGKILISADNGKTWEELFNLDDKTVEEKNINGRNRLKNYWFLDGFDIPQKYLTNSFKMKFELSTGSEVDGATAGGWYIDDVSIFDTAPKNEIVPHAAGAQQDAGDDASTALAVPETAHESHTALALSSTSGTFAPTQKPLIPVE